MGLTGGGVATDSVGEAIGGSVGGTVGGTVGGMSVFVGGTGVLVEVGRGVLVGTGVDVNVDRTA